jgi:hypothetical protein
VTGWCAQESRARGESPLGTASRARRWILLEQPGAWGRDALRESDLPPAVAERLLAWSRDLPARVLLLRRPAGGRPIGTERALYAGVSGPGERWLEWLPLEHVDDLLDLDLTPLRDGRTLGGLRVLDPLYLVCTNGKHDPCCARDGLPIARDLVDVVPDRVWESSHVGGDRFAGNLVCLPDGLFYGHLDVGSARAAVAANEGGRIDLEHFRGRSCHPFAVQAAEGLLRRRLAIQGTDALALVDVERRGDRHLVRFVHRDGRTLVAEIATGRAGTQQPLTCSGPPASAPSYDLVGVREE